VDPNRPGLSITKTYKVGDKIMMSRETVKATVFGDRIAPPTMSLEEFAELEVEDAQRRAQSQAEAPQGPKRYNQLLAEGEEDNIDLVDEATIQDRNWDNWKDENPRGWGNKMGKRF
jgi:immunoglobulin-binding protein 1